jgi:hypothetical protein
MYKLHSYTFQHFRIIREFTSTCITRQTSAIGTSTMGLYMQPQIHNECMRDCNIERFYYIVKQQHILTIL